MKHVWILNKADLVNMVFSSPRKAYDYADKNFNIEYSYKYMLEILRRNYEGEGVELSADD